MAGGSVLVNLPLPGATRRAGGVRRRRTPRVPWLDSTALVLLGLLTVAALFASLLAPHSTGTPSGLPFSPPSSHAFFGTDEVGRDIFSRVLLGLRTTWFGSLLVIAVGVLVGGTVGLIAGACGGWVDNVLMRLTDLFLALPGTLLAIAIVAALGPSLPHTLMAVSLVWWPYYARIVRGEVRALASRPHVEAARLAGTGRVRIAVRHLLPGALPATVVAASLDVGNLVLTLATLSFLGLGAPAPAPELGAMAARGLPYLLQQWWVPVLPGVAVMVIALLANLAGDAMSDLVGTKVGGTR